MINLVMNADAIDSTQTFTVNEKAVFDALIASPTLARRFLKFESFPLIDTISGTLIQNIGSETPIIEPGAFGNGLRLRPDSLLSIDYSPKDNRQLSMGFWWNPAWQRPAVGQEDGAVAYYRSPIVSKSRFSLDLVSQMVSADDATFVIYEESIEDELNRMYILLQDPDGLQSIWSSPSYSAGQYHYFWISYDGVQGRLSLYTDGVEQDLNLEQGDGVPSNLNISQNTQLRINESAIGKNSLLRRSYSSIDEFFIEDARQFEPSIISRHINFGSEYAYDAQLSKREKILCGSSFDDPSAISVSSAFSNGTNIYSGRTDGQVFKGDRLLWESRRDFANRDELNHVKISFLSSESSVSVDNGSLKISKASVRL